MNAAGGGQQGENIMESKYIDGISQIHFLNNMVRMDAFVLAPVPNQDPKQESAGQIVMSPQGFIAALGAMQQMADRLVENGVLQRVEQR